MAGHISDKVASRRAPLPDVGKGRGGSGGGVARARRDDEGVDERAEASHGEPVYAVREGLRDTLGDALVLADGDGMRLVPAFVSNISQADPKAKIAVIIDGPKGKAAVRHRFPVKHAVKQRFNTTRARAQDLRTSKHGGRNRMDGGMAEALTPTRNVRLTPQRDPDPCIAHLRKTSPFKAFIQYRTSIPFTTHQQQVLTPPQASKRRKKKKQDVLV